MYRRERKRERERARESKTDRARGRERENLREKPLGHSHGGPPHDFFVSALAVGISGPVDVFAVDDFAGIYPF
jgi:hypothetical protein